MIKPLCVGISILIFAFLAYPGSLAATSQEKTGAGQGSQSSDKTVEILEATESPDSLIGMQYETWFTPRNNGKWETAEAIPILGRYSSYDVNVIKKHAEWFERLGIDWLLIDWSNMLWMKPAWEKHAGATRELEETTELLLKTYSQLEKEGRRAPKVVLLLGLENGPPVRNGVKRLNGIIRWVTKRFLAKKEYKKLWLYYHGKPLIVILFNTRNPCRRLEEYLARTPLVAPDWTVRWMASQLQDTHAEKCGMWSWMDGTIRQVVTYKEGIAEATVVTPACFPMPEGWLDPRAIGRDNGAPYIESWKVAFEHRPKFIQIHQWNEFAGQKEGKGYGPNHDIYGDEYNLELSDDLEPTRMDECGYRGCGGWGYYYVNMTRALISLYRGETPDITVMALSGPSRPEVVEENSLSLRWSWIGKQPSSYTLKVDGKTIAENVQGEKYTLDLSRLEPGKHTVTLVANGVHTYFDLGPEEMAEKSSAPLPVTSTIEFICPPPSR